MNYGSVCSGIEAATVAWHPLGWRASFFSEIEPFPRSVLAYHYPEVPLHGDFTTIRSGDYAPIDLLVGGTPCQSFSVAGLRKGLDDPRGNLMLGFGALAQRLRPRWLVWENVPGVLSSNGGRDFGTFLGMLGILGYGFAYRVLDAQHFGVPQRRRRVFVVGCLGDWRRASAVLFERHSLQGHPAPRREAGKAVAAGTLRSTDGGCDVDHGRAGHLIPSAGEISHCLNAGGMGRQDYETETLVTHTLRGEGFDASEDGAGRGAPLVPVAYRTTGNDGCYETGDQVGALTCSTDPNAQVVAFREVAGTLTSNYGKQPDSSDTSLGPNLAGTASAVRRLTPRECERLQGFPDDYTLIPLRRSVRKRRKNEPGAHYAAYLAAQPMAKDGPRYKALGNSMAVPVMRWIGERIAAVASITALREAA